MGARDADLVPGAVLAGDNVCHHLALRHCTVCQHRLARDVPDGVDSPHRCAALIVDTDERAVHIEVDRLEAPVVGQRLAADGHEDLVGGKGHSPSVCRLDGERIVLGSEPLGLGAG